LRASETNQVVRRRLGATLGPPSQRLDGLGREVDSPRAPALGVAHVDDPGGLLAQPWGDRRSAARGGVAAKLLEVAVPKGADLCAPQPGLAEQQHDGELAASAAGAPVGHGQ
jgi:hypothetical protein